MNCKIVYLPEAKDDINEIRKYLSKFYPSTPKTFFALLKKRISNLKQNPFICQPYEKRPSYRRLVVNDYLVFYKVDESRHVVQIHRILHGSCDIGRYI